MHKGKEVVNTTPRDLKRLRACIYCHLIKTEEQFRDTGCDNCNISMKDTYSLYDHTSENFEGMISLIDSQHSWVARANNLVGKVPGCYCIEVEGENVEEEEDYGEIEREEYE